MGGHYSAIHDVIAFDGGGFATFYSTIVDGNSRELSMQKFNNDGSLDGDAIAIITPVSDSKFGGLPSNMNVTQLQNGNFLMTWGIADARDNSFDLFSVRGQIFDAEGQTIGKVRDMYAGANSVQRDSEVTATKDGGYIVTWRETTSVGNRNDIFVQKFNAKAPDKLYGGKGADSFVFKAGVDGKDKIFGFENSQDSIQISSVSAITVTTAAGNTLIEYDGAGGGILLKGVVLTEMDISFDFV